MFRTRSGLESVRSRTLPVPERSSFTRQGTRVPPLVQSLKTPPFKSKTLTRKLPFAQVLGFALLAARHVGFVAAL